MEGRGRAGERARGRWNRGEAWAPVSRARAQLSRVFPRHSSQPVHTSPSLQTEKLRPRGQGSASRTRGQVRQSPRGHLPTRLSLGSPAPRGALAEPGSQLAAWCPSVGLRGCLSAGLRREKATGGQRGRRPPVKAAKAPGCRSLNRQPGLGRGRGRGVRTPDARSGGRGGDGGDLLVAPGAGRGRQLQPKLLERSGDQSACGADCARLGSTEGCARRLECIGEPQGPAS